jgi:hypothetical protein
MLKQLVSVMIVAGTLAGCGTPAMAPVSSAPGPRMQAATSNVVLTDGSQVLNSPKDSLPIRMTITVNGTKGGQPFKVVVKTFNAHYYYVPTAQSATVNGATVPASRWKALSDEIGKATTSTPAAAYFSSLVDGTLRFSAPRNGEAGAVAGTATDKTP